jgi:DNA-binding IclR family transcriptional regulator
MGLQTVDRAVAVMHLLGGNGAAGLRLVDVQARLKLSKPTAHRLLTSLVSHGFVEQDDATRRYRLGARLAVLAWSVPQRRPDLGRIGAISAQRLAQLSGDTVFLMANDGLDSVCVGRETGSFPIKVLALDVGTRRPIGVGAGGIAVLATMPPDDVGRILETIEPRLKDYPLTSVQAILRLTDQARRLGYGVSDGNVVDGIGAVAVAIRDARGTAIGSIGIAAIRTRMTPARVKALAGMLLEERTGIERRLGA